MKRKTSTKYYIKCTTWKGKTQVSFCPQITLDQTPRKKISQFYVEVREHGRKAGLCEHGQYHFNRDSINYSTTITSHQLYLRIMWSVLEHVIHVCFIIVYAKAMALGSYLPVIIAWSIYFAMLEARDGQSKCPYWMRQGSCVPCECERCYYFCLKDHPTGIADRAKKQKAKVVDVKAGAITWTNKCPDNNSNLK